MKAPEPLGFWCVPEGEPQTSGTLVYASSGFRVSRSRQLNVEIRQAGPNAFLRRGRSISGWQGLLAGNLICGIITGTQPGDEVSPHFAIFRIRFKMTCSATADCEDMGLKTPAQWVHRRTMKMEDLGSIQNCLKITVLSVI